MTRPEAWADSQRAQEMGRRLAGLREEVGIWRDLERRARAAAELLDLALEEGDFSLKDDLEKEVGEIQRRLEDLEFQLAMSGEYEERDALLSIHAGAGGTEAQDWAQMLLRMYLRWCEKRGFETQILDLSPGEEAGIKSALVEVRGRYAYGYLKAEKGVHRLVRISPFDASHRRHTSFALVEVIPKIKSDIEVVIRPEDLKIETFRASGPGGQHMQKNETAVRITHIPTGIVVTCQNERSQHQNKETALRILKSRLLQLELQKKAEEEARLRGEYVPAAWGNQIRSYVLHPYKMVKDHRTGFETSDAEAVLDGELDDFIKAYLKSTLGKKAA